MLGKIAALGRLSNGKQFVEKPRDVPPRKRTLKTECIILLAGMNGPLLVYRRR
jgi:hypothetical protein